MEFEIDVSGNDLLSKDYTICIANRDSIIKGFKLNEKILGTLVSRFGKGLYKYNKSKKGKANFKIRLYCIIVYYLFDSLDFRGDLTLNICRDFSGREAEIKKSLSYFLEDISKFKIRDRIYFIKLNDNSNAHKYSYLMRHDIKNKMDTYVNINIEDLEKWLK